MNKNNTKKDNKNDDKLQKVMDSIREKYGHDTIIYADMLKKNKN